MICKAVVSKATHGKFFVTCSKTTTVIRLSSAPLIQLWLTALYKCTYLLTYLQCMCVFSSRRSSSRLSSQWQCHMYWRWRGKLVVAARKRVQQLKKRRKSCFLDFQKKRKNLKHTYNFSWLFNVYCSSSLLSESDIVHTRCSAMAQNGSHSRIWELNYSDHWAKYVNSFRWIED